MSQAGSSVGWKLLLLKAETKELLLRVVGPHACQIVIGSCMNKSLIHISLTAIRLSHVGKKLAQSTSIVRSLRARKRYSGCGRSLVHDARW